MWTLEIRVKYIFYHKMNDNISFVGPCSDNLLHIHLNIDERTRRINPLSVLCKYQALVRDLKYNR